MGNALDSCFGKKGEDEAVIIEPKEEFSWQKKKKLDPADYCFDDLVGVTAGKLPGQIKGEQFSIENCQDCILFVLDNVATVTIDDCTNCVIFIGPSKGSVFIRDSSDVKLAVSCQQFRSRDCKRVDTFLHSNTQPIIESSSTMKFTCLEFYYKQLYDQFEASGLSMYNNEWSNVFDFSPVTDMQNFSLLPQNIKFDSFLTQHHVKEVCDAYGEDELIISSDRSVFPLTVGNRSSGTDRQNTLLVLFLGNTGTYAQVNKILDSLKRSECYLRRSKEVSMTSDDVKRIFQGSENASQYINAAKQGHVIGLEVEGSYDYSTKLELLNYTSSERSSGRDLNAFFNFVDMTMST